MVQIRKAVSTDVDRIVELWTEMWTFHYQFDERFAPSPLAPVTMRHWIEGHLDSPHSAVFVAQKGTDVVGYLLATILENMPIVMTPAFGFISEIAVTRQGRRKGIGARLLQEAHAWFRTQHITTVEVNVSVKNAVSRSFWRKMGYRDFIERMQKNLE